MSTNEWLIKRNKHIKQAHNFFKEAEKILSDKLCRCIKSVNKKGALDNEPRSIGICTKTIFNNKGLTRGKFKCKKPTKFVKFNKTMKNRK